MTAVVTGGSGFVGGAIVRRLVADGQDVLALVRSAAASTAASALGARPVIVDLVDVPAVSDAIRGADVVFHVAGRTAMCPRRPELLDRDNVDLAVSVVRAAARAGVPRVVHTSSAATLGERAGEVGREDAPHRGWFLSPYERSKYLGERAVLGAAPDLGVEVVVVNPCSVQGPGRHAGSAELLWRVARSRVPVLVKTWISMIDVDDCAEGHVLAASRGVAGERYVLSGASLGVPQALEVLRSVTGGPHRVLWVPPRVVRAVGPLTELARLGSMNDPLVCPAVVRTLLHGHRYDGTRATRELGLRYRPVEETLERTLSWARDRGFLQASGRG
jgi:dihydroflavonol-4-reductase